MRAFERIRFCTGLFILAPALVACGGGASRTPGPSMSPISTAAPASTGNVAVTLKMQNAPQSIQRRPQYVSQASQSIAISVNGGAPTVAGVTPTSPNCSGSPLECTISLSAPVGNDTFTISLYDGANATGNKLSTGATTFNVVSGQNSLNIALNGILASISISLSPSGVTSGVAATLHVTLSAFDADGFLIAGPGSYADANGDPLTITLTDSDTSGATTISPSGITAPTSAINLTYNGAAITSPSISATVSGGRIAGSIMGAVLAVGAAQSLYVANREGASVLSFPVSGPYGNVAPGTAVTGANTQLTLPDGLAVDTSGNIYVGEDDNAVTSVIAVFPPGANGNVAPSHTFTTTFNLFRTEGLLVNSTGNVYVASWGGALIDVFAPAPSGSVTPAAVISGANTLLAEPIGMTLNGGNLYVADYTRSAVYVYSANANGNVAPTAAIAGANTQLSHPGEVALDSTGRIIVANTGTTCCSSGFVLIFASGASGNVAPVAKIGGSNTGLLVPSGVAVDSVGNIWVSDASASAIFRFATNANGNVAPTATISGALTTLLNPQGLTIH